MSERTTSSSPDEQVVATASLDDLHPPLWVRFRTTERSSDARDDLLQKLGMARLDDEGVFRPTVAGVLMASRSPERWLPSAFIQAAAYRGTEPLAGGDSNEGRVYQLDAKDIAGPLDEQIVEACRFVERNMRIFAVKDVGRIDLPQFDRTAVFEAIVNAVAHRDYSIHGSKIRVRIFTDRLEIYSPGAIANTMTVESLAYCQAARNETLTSLLAKCPIPPADWIVTDRHTFMDRRGEGVPLILRNSERRASRLPDYRLLDDAELVLVIYGMRPEDRDPPSSI